MKIHKLLLDILVLFLHREKSSKFSSLKIQDLKIFLLLWYLVIAELYENCWFIFIFVLEVFCKSTQFMHNLNVLSFNLNFLTFKVIIYFYHWLYMHIYIYIYIYITYYGYYYILLYIHIIIIHAVLRFFNLGQYKASVTW